jgi:UDP:flavonoid glycosyltransferase YjiC (YdhE family)
MTRSSRRTILFVAENVTLGQVSRLVALARALQAEPLHVVFACAEFDERVLGEATFEHRPIYSIPRERVFAALAAGKRIYDRTTLERYIAEELSLLEQLEPALVVGNFRLSLAVSAPAAKVALATVVNAHWSPFAVRDAFPVPDHPTVKLVGLKTALRFFPKALPAAFAHFARPVNELRKRHGLKAIGSLPEVMTWGDYTLHPDLPQLAPTAGLPQSHQYLGPVLFSPPVPLPDWWRQVPEDRPIVYATLGSSGALHAWQPLQAALAQLPVTVIAATAGRIEPGSAPRTSLWLSTCPGTWPRSARQWRSATAAVGARIKRWLKASRWWASPPASISTWPWLLSTRPAAG